MPVSTQRRRLSLLIEGTAKLELLTISLLLLLTILLGTGTTLTLPIRLSFLILDLDALCALLSISSSGLVVGLALLLGRGFLATLAAGSALLRLLRGRGRSRGWGGRVLALLASVLKQERYPSASLQ